jgi:hypothetical protein
MNTATTALTAARLFALLIPLGCGPILVDIDITGADTGSSDGFGDTGSGPLSGGTTGDGATSAAVSTGTESTTTDPDTGEPECHVVGPDQQCSCDGAPAPSEWCDPCVVDPSGVCYCGPTEAPGEWCGLVDYCPDGTAAMEADRCVCTLADGERRPVDPLACGCDGEGQPCECTDGPHPSWSCAWPCQDLLAGQGCECDGQPAPTPFCSYACESQPGMVEGQCVCSGHDGAQAIDPQWCGCEIWVGGVCSCGGPIVPNWFCGLPQCDGDIEVDIVTERCECVSALGLPDAELDSDACGCEPVVDKMGQEGCECDGVTYPPETCT